MVRPELAESVTGVAQVAMAAAATAQTHTHRSRRLQDGRSRPAASEVRVDAVENDDVIAYALQEELAQVAMAEASGADSGEAEQRATVLAQQWFRPEVVIIGQI